MKTCKYNIYDDKVINIKIDMLENDGKKTAPYFNESVNGEINCYAICRKCNNPVELIGLYKKNKISEKPFGKHYNKSIPDLADYNQDAYDFCPLAEKKINRFPKRYKKEMDSVSIQIYNTVRNKFDKVIYLLEKDSGLHFSKTLIKSLLEEYRGRKGWLYRGARIDNIPWIFAYMTLQHKFIGRWIVKDSKLHKELLKHKDIIEIIPTNLKKYVQVKPNKPGLNLNFYFTNHRAKADSNDNIYEYIDFVIYENYNDSYNDFPENYNRIATLKIEMDINYFLAIIKKPSYNDTQVELSKNILPKIEG